MFKNIQVSFSVRLPVSHFLHLILSTMHSHNVWRCCILPPTSPVVPLYSYHQRTASGPAMGRDRVDSSRGVELGLNERVCSSTSHPCRTHRLQHVSLCQSTQNTDALPAVTNFGLPRCKSTRQRSSQASICSRCSSATCSTRSSCSRFRARHCRRTAVSFLCVRNLLQSCASADIC